MMTAFVLHSQDTGRVWIPRQHALATLARAEKAVFLEEKLAAKQRDIDTLALQISIKQEIINELKETVNIDSAIIDTYEKEIVQMKEQRALLEGEVTVLRKQIRKERRKRRWTAIAGVFTTAGAFWLGTKF
jgi:hypothetical protein